MYFNRDNAYLRSELKNPAYQEANIERIEKQCAQAMAASLYMIEYSSDGHENRTDNNGDPLTERLEKHKQADYRLWLRTWVVASIKSPELENND